MIAEGNTVGIFGFAGGTCRGNKTPPEKRRWRLPTAWKSVVAEGKIKVWQVFCDSKVPYELIRENMGRDV